MPFLDAVTGRFRWELVFEREYLQQNRRKVSFGTTALPQAPADAIY
jgi:hypothetical protein